MTDDPRPDPGEGQRPTPPFESLGEKATLERPDEVFEVVEDALLDLWNVVDDLSRIRAREPEYYRVTIFGSSRMQPGDPVYDDVRTLARKLAAMGCDIVTGGGPGLMQAANEGEALGDEGDRTRSYGLNIDVPDEQAPNPFVEKAYTHRTFFSRLHHFVRLSHAFVVVQGGIGTTLEALMIWQLLQVRHLTELPLVMVGEMWEELVGWARRHMLGEPRNLADPGDLELPRCVGSVDEAIEIIRRDQEDHPGAAR